MAKFVVRVQYMLDGEKEVECEGGYYAYPRRSTGIPFMRETHFGPDLDEARVFNTRAEAVDAMRGLYLPHEYEVIPVKLTLNDIINLAKGKKP